LATSHGGLLNAVGLTNPGIDSFAEEMAELKKSDVPIVLSIFGNSPQELADVASKGLEMKPNAIELNLSCPLSCVCQDYA
jgi:dihydroorotate dehydrogenase (NAD+) catalytic subunit